MDDWFLPSKDELNLIYVNLCLNNLSSFDLGSNESYYWSSSEYNDNPRAAWYQRFLNGSQNWGDGKSSRKSVRPVRAFTDDEPYGHNYTSEITKTPTCTEIGYCTYTCQDCGFSYVGAIPEQHDWNDDDQCNICMADRYYVGAKGPAGGYIIYADTQYQDGWRYIEIAPDSIGSAVFGYLRNSDSANDNVNIDGSTDYYPNVHTTSSYDGKTNTEAIVDAFGSQVYSAYSGDSVTDSYAAKMCAEYCLNGYEDWYLPSIEECRYVYDGFKDVRSVGSYYYWTSCEANPNSAFVFYPKASRWPTSYGYMTYDAIYSNARSSECLVRPVRRF